MRLKHAIAAVFLCLGFAATASAQDPSPLSVVSVHHYGEGTGHVFEFDIENASDRAVTTRGRLVVINVYDASLPTTILVRDITVLAKSTSTAIVRWDGAPLIGQIRTLLVLNDGRHPLLVESDSYLVLPLLEASIFVVISALVLAFVLAAMRLPKYLKARVPANTVPYDVEFDDTVVTLSNRFEVSWQDIVRANRLKPPYDLKPGRRVFIPMHDLRRPSVTDIS